MVQISAIASLAWCNLRMDNHASTNVHTRGTVTIFLVMLTRLG